MNACSRSYSLELRLPALLLCLSDHGSSPELCITNGFFFPWCPNFEDFLLWVKVVARYGDVAGSHLRWLRAFVVGSPCHTVRNGPGSPAPDGVLLKVRLFARCAHEELRSFFILLVDIITIEVSFEVGREPTLRLGVAVFNCHLWLLNCLF